METVYNLKERAIVKARPPIHIVIFVLNVIIPGIIIIIIK